MVRTVRPQRRPVQHAAAVPGAGHLGAAPHPRSRVPPHGPHQGVPGAGGEAEGAEHRPSRVLVPESNSAADSR